MKLSSIRKTAYAASSWGVVTLVATLSMAVLSTAKAQTPGAAPMAGKPPMMAEGGHGGHHGMRGRGEHGGMGMAGGLPERALWAIDATPEQRAKLKTLGESFQADMKPLHEQMRSQRQKGMELFSAATLDKAAIEKQRQEHLALQDKISKRMTTHMTDSAEVLTPAQRTKIAQAMKSRMEGRSGHHGMGAHLSR